jgi:hypothetical protein
MPGEDVPGVMGTDARQRDALIGHPLSLHSIREGLALSRISAPPPSPRLTGGGHPCPHASISLLSGTA